MADTRFRGRIPVSLADITGDAATIAADLDHIADRDGAERLARDVHGKAADAGWAPDWDALTPGQRNRATLDALPYLRAMRRILREASS